MMKAMTKFLFGSGDPLEIGADAPAISALDQDGKTVSLGDLYQKGVVLVYFYPRADTPGCTKQACSLRDEFEVLTDRGVTVIGVSNDGPEAQKKFQQKLWNTNAKLPVPDSWKKANQKRLSTGS